MAKKIALTAALAGIGTLAFLSMATPGLGEPGGSTAENAGPKPVRISVQDNFFDPRSTGVLQNAKVVWIWRGTNRHNIVFTKVPPGASRKGAKTRTGGRWKRAFNVPGIYKYVCRFYAGMRGTITVKSPPPPSN
jgi:plastocyanin